MRKMQWLVVNCCCCWWCCFCNRCADCSHAVSITMPRLFT